MTDETEQKILDAALKLFSKKGYESATTIAIAEEAGFNEKTLFRKFKTKKNLYDMMAVQYIDKLKEDFACIFKDYICETPKDFLNTVVTDLAAFCDDNYEIIHLILEETSKPSEPFMIEWVGLLSKHLEDNLKNDAIDYPIFAMTILSFTYTLAGEKYHGRAVFNMDEAIEKFIDNLALGICS
ncbi:MAG: TetR/AcrR family transcriptional regulator [Methanobacterium sp.]|uniref:TetR/AcrR family transcriptional regulator n=1 Tax=Methanobacterium sp. TaxID=2164 RepID=UPI003D656765|nr:TetR/AcrR family transcriptional regulator [Methanobacterium sp.]